MNITKQKQEEEQGDGRAPGARMPERLLLVGGVGAVGSRLVARLDPAAALVCADRDVIALENLGVAALDPGEAVALLGRAKSAVAADRHRARGARAAGLHGDVRYTVTPGLAAAVDAAVLCFDNPGAFRDAAAVLWTSARPGTPVLAVTCGGDDDEQWQVRLFATGGPCPACLQSPGERRDGAAAPGTSCESTETVEAPRASATAAEAAARAGVTMFTRVMEGERGLLGSRVQRDGARTAAWTVHMPAAPVAGCPTPHGRSAPPIEELAGGIDAITVQALAGRALEVAGPDATIMLGRRSLPLGSFRCPGCDRSSSGSPRLLPAAAARAHACECPAVLLPLGERHVVAAASLLNELNERGGDAAAGWSLREWGASPGDGFLVVGERATVELRCRLAWDELGGRDG